MIVQRSHVFSIIVAWGYHLRVPLRSRNRKSCAPRGEKYATINKNSRQRWHNFCHCGQTRHWRGRTPSPPATRLLTPSQDPSQHAIYPILCQQGSRDEQSPSHTVPKISIISRQPYAIVRSTAAAPSCCPIVPQIDTDIDNISIDALVSYCCLLAFNFIHCHLEF